MCRAPEAANRFLVLVTYVFFGTFRLKQTQTPLQAGNCSGKLLPGRAREEGHPKTERIAEAVLGCGIDSRLPALAATEKQVVAQSDFSPSATAESNIDTPKAAFPSCLQSAGGDGGGFHVAKGEQGASWNPATSRPGTCRGGLSRRRLGEGGSVRVLAFGLALGSLSKPDDPPPRF